MVLQAVSDADYKFSVIEISGKGRQSDEATFHFSKFNELLTNYRFKYATAKNITWVKYFAATRPSWRQSLSTKNVSFATLSIEHFR